MSGALSVFDLAGDIRRSLTAPGALHQTSRVLAMNQARWERISPLDHAGITGTSGLTVAARVGKARNDATAGEAVPAAVRDVTGRTEADRVADPPEGQAGIAALA